MRSQCDKQHSVYESGFLCPGCQQPLYVQLKTRREACLNTDCIRWPPDYSSILDAHEEHEPLVYKELEENRARIWDRIWHCNLASLRRFAHEERRKLGLSFFNKGRMRISEWHALSELLALTQQEPSKRLHTVGDESEYTFQAILRQVDAWAERMRLMEDLRTGRYLILRRQNGNLDNVALKYLLAVRNDQRALGLVSSFEQLDELTFEYEHIEEAAIPPVAQDTQNMAEFLETLWPFSLHIRHAFNSHWRTSQLYDYQPHLVDFSALAGYWIASSDDDKTHRIPAEKEKDEVARLV